MDAFGRSGQSRAVSTRHRILTGNRLLDALPQQEFERFRPHLEPESFLVKQVICRPGDEVPFVYFPTAGMLSIITPLSDGTCVETGTCGNEGLLGLSALLGDGVARHQVVVQGTGRGFRARARTVRHEVNHSARFRGLVLKLSQLVINVISQTAACNGHHSLEQRCARWLLTMQDVLEVDRFFLSQEFLATLLGVRRSGVTAASIKFRHEGIIQYRRGILEILDRRGLEAATCECYAIMRGLRERFPQ